MLDKFFKSEIKRFMDLERLDERYRSERGLKGYGRVRDGPNGYNAVGFGNASLSGAAEVGAAETAAAFQSLSGLRSGGINFGGAGAETEESAPSEQTAPQSQQAASQSEIPQPRQTAPSQTESQPRPTKDLFGEGRPVSANADEYLPVQSSNLRAVKYDTQTSMLYVRFVSGSEYSYENVPFSQYGNLMNASSHGSYFYWNIRGAGVPYPSSPPYPYRRI